MIEQSSLKEITRLCARILELQREPETSFALPGEKIARLSSVLVDLWMELDGVYGERPRQR
jgi:hypothetical protein